MKDLKNMGKAKKLSPIELKAKTNVLEQLKQAMQDEMGGKLSGLKKVTVASDSKHGLEQGLDKAKHLLGSHEDADQEQVEGAEEDMHEDLDHDHEEGESPEHQDMVMGHDEEESPSEEASESPEDEMSEDSLDKKIQELLAKKEMMKKKV